MSKHSQVIEFGSKANADRYIAAGWELIEKRAEPFALGRTIIVYYVGGPEGAGDPVRPPTDDDLTDLEEGHLEEGPALPVAPCQCVLCGNTTALRRHSCQISEPLCF